MSFTIDSMGPRCQHGKPRSLGFHATETPLSQVPGILTALQRSVQAVLLGKMHHPDWLSQGIRDKARTDSIAIAMPTKGDALLKILRGFL